MILMKDLCPPIGMLVDFIRHTEVQVERGMVASLGTIGPDKYCETVFVCHTPRRVYFRDEVNEWMEIKTEAQTFVQEFKDQGK